MGFSFSTTVNTDWGNSKTNTIKHDWDMTPPPPLPTTNDGYPVLASNNGYLGPEGGSSSQNNNNPIRVEANSETPFGPGQIHDQIIEVSQLTTIKFNNLDNSDKITFLGIDNTLLGTVRNGNYFSGRESYNIGFLYENNLSYFQNNTSIIVRVLGGTTNPTAFYYDIYNGFPIGTSNIYTPQVDFTRIFGR